MHLFYHSFLLTFAFIINDSNHFFEWFESFYYRILKIKINNQNQKLKWIKTNKKWKKKWFKSWFKSKLIRPITGWKILWFLYSFSLANNKPEMVIFAETLHKPANCFRKHLYYLLSKTVMKYICFLTVSQILLPPKKERGKDNYGMVLYVKS